MTWCVWYDSNKKYLVEAETSDEALRKGREIDPRACATQVYLPEFKEFYHGIVTPSKKFKIPLDFFLRW